MSAAKILELAEEQGLLEPQVIATLRKQVQARESWSLRRSLPKWKSILRLMNRCHPLHLHPLRKKTTTL